MREYDHPLQRIGIQMLLFVLGLLVITWPIVAQSSPWSLGSLLGYLFSIWACVVVLLFLISRVRYQGSEQESDKTNESDTNTAAIQPSDIESDS
ncbi:MAG: hypothetical protein V7739_03290 [Motiliproteus sp.]